MSLVLLHFRLPTSHLEGGRNQRGYENHYDQDERREARLMGLVADEGNDHAVQVEEEHEQVEA